MKKKLAFLLAVVMVLTSLPGLTLLASSNNTVSRTIATENNTLLFEEGMGTGSGEFVDQHSGRNIQTYQEGAFLQIEARQPVPAGTQFHVYLENAAWYFRQEGRTLGLPAISWDAGVDASVFIPMPLGFTVDLVVPHAVADALWPGSFPTGAFLNTGADLTPAQFDALLAGGSLTFGPTNIHNALNTAMVTAAGAFAPQTPPASPAIGDTWYDVNIPAAQAALTALLEDYATAPLLAWNWEVVTVTDLLGNDTVTVRFYATFVPTNGAVLEVTEYTAVASGAASVEIPNVQGPGLPLADLGPWPATHRDTFRVAHQNTGGTGGWIQNIGGTAADAHRIVYTRVENGVAVYTLEIVGGNWQTRATVTVLAGGEITAADVAGGNPAARTLRIPIIARTTGSGDVRARIDRGTSQISSGNVLVAGQTDGRVNITVGGVGVAHHQVTIPRFIMTEQRPGSIPSQLWQFELRAPSGYEWDLRTGMQVILDAPLRWVGGATGARAVGSESGVWVEYRVGRNNVPDHSVLLVTVNRNAAGNHQQMIQPSTTGSGGAMIITNLALIPDDPERVTDGQRLYVNVRNTEREVLPSGNVFITTARDFGITLTRVPDRIPELVSGRYEIRNAGHDAVLNNNGTWSGEALDDYHRAATVRFAETIRDSWWSMRNTIFELPEGVRFLQVEIYDTRSMYNNAATQNLHRGSNQGSGGPLSPAPWYNAGRRIGPVTVDNNRMILHGLTVDGTARFDLRLWLNIQVDFEGDIELTLANSAFRQVADNYDASVVIATAVSPIEVITEVSHARVGFQFVTVADFEIVENVAGALLQGERVFVTVTDDMAIDMAIAPGFRAEVTDGNIRISNVRTNSILGWSGVSGNAQLEFTIERESTIASTIAFSNVQVRIDRTVPFSNLSIVETQGYDIHVWGPAVARNFRGLHPNGNFNPGNWNERDFFPVGSISEQYVIVETTGEFGQVAFGNHVEVPIGESFVRVNGERVELEVATWICPVSNSAMVPIRFVAYALGIEQGNVRWDPETSTVTVDANHRIVQFQTGSSFYVVNGVPIRMLNTAGQPVEMQIRHERSFVPFRALGEAFHIPVSWDADNATAIYNAPTHF